MAKQAAETVKPNILVRTRGYIHDVKAEMDKVTWPTRADLKASTTVVLLFLALLAVLIGSMDLIFQRAVLLLYSLT
ncbi:MAG: preprotein translocase subunit SecE [Candidatus Hydrogenedentota bacterium]|nr:MAG: preprotein translocase subunit SecE [Candidatus Hydrogenedentota bacterium]